MDKNIEPFKKAGIGRRQFLALAGAGAILPILAACASGSSTSGSTASSNNNGSSKSIQFWDGILGSGIAVPNGFNTLSKQIVADYVPPKGLGKATYQLMTAPNLYQYLQAAIASGTGPAVSGGYAYQAFQFANQGSIAYADNLVAELKKDGIYQDYPKAAFDSFKTDKGYVALPWGADARMLWVNLTLLHKAGIENPPTTWDEWLTAGKALKKIGVYGFGTAAGTGALWADHAMISLMINNGGGPFDEDGKPDGTYSRNVEAMEFVLEMNAAGMIDPASVSYTSNDLYNQFKNGQVAMGFVFASLPQATGITDGTLTVTDPLKGPHGTQGTLQYLKNYMMYTNTPNQASSEAFMKSWLQAFTGKDGLFSKGNNSTGSLPIRKSVIDLPAFKDDPVQSKILKEWIPVAKTYSARGTKQFAGLANVDAGPAEKQMAQQMLQGKTSAKEVLATWQAGMKAALGQ